MSSDRVTAELHTSLDGLKTKEVARRLAAYGKNVIQDGRGFTPLSILGNQLKSPLLLVLVAATGITIFLAEWVNAAVLAATIAVNAGLGFWQEYKAEAVLEKLKSYIRTRSRVRRDGLEREIDSTELVPGDVIRISQGDRVPADGRILFSQGLQIDESVLTGESLPVEKNEKPVEKDASLGDRTCMAWSGTLVVQGLADVVVTATDNQTEFGRIAALVSSRKREGTPLQKAVATFATRASLALGALSVAMFGIGLLAGVDPNEMFFIAVAVAVSAVPEGLPISLTVILAVGVERLARKKGVVRKLLAAETLGSTSLILTDKTGTLTKAEMRLTDVIPYETDADRLLKNALLNTEVAIENPDADPKKWILAGRAMESALVRDAGIRGLRLSDVQAEARVLERVPFNSTQKYSAVTVEEGGKRRTVALGAPEIVLALCRMKETDANRIKADIERRAGSGERLLGVAEGADMHALSFQGLLALRDPLRPGVKEAMARIGASGVKTVIVTGDHKGTAEAVARELGMMRRGNIVVTGTDLDTWPAEELERRLPKIRVFARVTPEHKLMLAKLYKSHDEVVAVTGDGVNDAPALEAADVGIAVGSGTDVAKSAADLVILDNDFSTIVLAIEEGRRIMQNIRKAIVYLLSNAFSELVLIGGSLMAGIPIPLTAIQILYVNFFSDSLPAIAYAFEETTPGDTAAPTQTKQLLDKQMRFLIVIVGGSLSLLLFFIYHALLREGFAPELVRTFTFATFGSYSLLSAFALRSLKEPIWKSNPFGNKFLLVGVAFGLALMAGAIYFPPLQTVLGTIALPWPWLLGVLAVAIVNVAGIELGKKFYRSST